MPPSVECDVAIIGGGPAGCAAAIALGQVGVSCALLERSRYDRPRFGESLPPSAAPLLRALGVWDRFLADGHAPSPGNLSVWGDPVPGSTAFITSPYGPGWHLDRLRFDRTLYSVAAATAVAKTGLGSIAARRTTAGWEVTAGEGDGLVRYAARVLVDATGRCRSLARLTTGPAHVLDRLLAVVGTCEQRGGAGADGRTWVEAVEDGWWYSAPVPDGQVVVAFLTDAASLRSHGGQPAEVLIRQLGWAELTASRIAAGSAWSDVTVLSASSYLSSRIAGPDFLTVGDAASAYDPLSSDGLCKALREGTVAASAIRRHLSGDCGAFPGYAAHVTGEFATYVRQHRWMYEQERRWPASAFWRARGPTRESPVPGTG